MRKSCSDHRLWCDSPDVKGVQVDDVFENKRLMFRPHLNLRKHGTIGHFWVKPKNAIWKDIQNIEQKISEGLKKPNVKRLARHLHELIGGYYPIKKLERNFGQWADEPSVAEMIDTMISQDDSAQKQ